MSKKLRPSGGYRDLAGFQTATLIYDATYFFCETFLDPRSRTVDQMVQAARSGRQNIAEGSRAAATSSQTELRLVNVARASLEELLLDYEDFLRHRRLPQWAPDSPEASEVRSVPRRFREDRTDPSDRSDLTNLSDAERWALYAPWLEHNDPAVRANTVICLIHQANYLLDRQIQALERQFVEGGGYSEQLAAARLAERGRKRRRDPADRPDPSALIPDCPQCGKPMVLRTAKAGKNPGSQFWGCTGYPDCRGSLPLDELTPGRDDRHEHRRPERTCHPEPGDQAAPGPA
jgi:four helix bundle suffix protein